LQQSVASGNLTAAQSAFNTYNQLDRITASTDSAISSASTPLATDMKALGTAISSGNVTTTQAAFATVQDDLKNTPSQAMASAQAAVAQTVQWVDDLLSIGSSSTSSSSSPDPITAIYNSVYGLGSSSSTTDPMVALLESKYAAASTSSSVAGTATAVSLPASGNTGSSASVNAYA